MADHDQTVQGLKGKEPSLLAVIALIVIQGGMAFQSPVALAQHPSQSRVPPIQKAPAPNMASSKETEKPEHATLTIIKSHHRRLVMKEDIVRMAVGDSEIVSAELVTNRELLLLGVESGRTTLLIWFKSGQLKQYLVIVERDLSVLHAALHHIHPSIGARLAPDRDAVLLTGLVPDASYSVAAEAVARDYLKAGQASGKKGKARAFVKGVGMTGGSGSSTGSQQSEGEGEVEAAPTAETVRIDAEIEPSVAVINLIRVEQLPLTPEEKIKEAIESIGGKSVIVRRILHGNTRDDQRDVFVLEGTAPHQVAVARILHVAAHVITGEATAEEDLKVLADESGGLTSRRAAQVGMGTMQQGMGGGGGMMGSVGQLGQVLQGGGASLRQIRQLQNLIGKNLGRAKIVSAAKGRLLSFITVKDLPQVRLNVRLYELNRNKLLTYNSDLMAIAGTFSQGRLNPAPNAIPFQGSEAARVGPDRISFQNVLSFLNGTLGNTAQFKAGQFALQAVFSLLNRLNITRTLSAPSMTVLSGELATFTVGGEVPIPQLFSPIIGGGNVQLPPGVFSSVELVPFGITLGIRPLVGDDDSITLDIVPSVTSPDPSLTLSLKETTGANQLTTAFRVRSFMTHAKVNDGEGLLMAGLLARDRIDDQLYPPWLGDIPGVEWLVRNFARRDDQQELVVVINPVIIREPNPDVGLLAFPPVHELPLVHRVARGESLAPSAPEATP
ncbi:MAG: pilus assembly protein N-terminal domain-containing protein [Nitrospira sp.]|nr:pilus assembly protein N-terminal domain-containing protein [Nitrospira sp.]